MTSLNLRLRDSRPAGAIEIAAYVLGAYLEDSKNVARRCWVRFRIEGWGGMVIRAITIEKVKKELLHL